jgi:hypothetical protein
MIVEKIGLEPTTSCMPCKRSSQLSYIPECVCFPAFGECKSSASGGLVKA